MKQSSAWAWKTIVWLLAALLFLLLIVLPLLMALLTRYSGQQSVNALAYLSWVEWVQRFAMWNFMALWVFYVGSCFASFLNVVAWRVPRGRSILGRSRCPYCHVPLAAGDNLPIVGWLRNRGCCRTCRLPISIRYLLVEILLGAIFLFVYMTVVVTGGTTLPIRPPDVGGGLELRLFDPKWDLIQIACYQLVLHSLLFTFALIEIQRRAVPWSVFIIGRAAGGILPLNWPAMQLVSWNFPWSSVWPPGRHSLDQCLYWACGLVAGAFGAAMQRGSHGWWQPFRAQLVPNDSDSDHSQKNNDAGCDSAATLSLIVAGLFLGWQSAVVVVALSLSLTPAIVAISNFVAQSRSRVVQGSKSQTAARVRLTIPMAPVVQTACLIHLCSWRWFNLLVDR